MLFPGKRSKIVPETLRNGRNVPADRSMIRYFNNCNHSYLLRYLAKDLHVSILIYNIYTSSTRKRRPEPLRR
jgi:hypothetical protein